MRIVFGEVVHGPIHRTAAEALADGYTRSVCLARNQNGGWLVILLEEGSKARSGTSALQPKRVVGRRLVDGTED